MVVQDPIRTDFRQLPHLWLPAEAVHGFRLGISEYLPRSHRGVYAAAASLLLHGLGWQVQHVCRLQRGREQGWCVVRGAHGARDVRLHVRRRMRGRAYCTIRAARVEQTSRLDANARVPGARDGLDDGCIDGRLFDEWARVQWLFLMGALIQRHLRHPRDRRPRAGSHFSLPRRGAEARSDPSAQLWHRLQQCRHDALERCDVRGRDVHFTGRLHRRNL